jgi:hypothetical protein
VLWPRLHLLATRRIFPRSFTVFVRPCARPLLLRLLPLQVPRREPVRPALQLLKMLHFFQPTSTRLHSPRGACMLVSVRRLL